MMSRRTRGKGMRKLAVVMLGLAILAGCSTNVVPEYSTRASNTLALREMAQGDVAMGYFAGPDVFYKKCRFGEKIAPPEGTTFAEYIKQAIAQELREAGLYDDNQSPRVVIRGKVDMLYFSSTLGEWNIEVSLHSSNGASMYASEYYDVKISGGPFGACGDVAAAFPDAVQNLIGNIVSSRDFRTLLM